MADIADKNPSTSDGFAVFAMLAPLLGLVGGLIWAAQKITYPTYGFELFAYLFGIAIGLAVSFPIGIACLLISRLRSVGESRARSIAFAVNVPGLLSALIVCTELATTARSHGDAKRVATYQSRLREDLTVAVRERWNLSTDLQRFAALKYSLEDPDHVYSEDTLRLIYAEFPEMQSYVVQNRGCTPEFLRARFDEAFRELQQKGFESKLAGIMRNPNTPIDLVEKIAVYPEHLYEAAAAAVNALKLREGRYIVRTGDKPESVASFFHLTRPELLALNPDVDFIETEERERSF